MLTGKRLFGLETEYGIQIEGVADMDVVVESMELIRAYLHVGLRSRESSYGYPRLRGR